MKGVILPRCKLGAHVVMVLPSVLAFKKLEYQLTVEIARGPPG